MKRLSPNRQTGYTSAMIEILKTNTNAILVCAHQQQVNWMHKHEGIPKSQLTSLNSDKYIPVNALVLYDNHTLEAIQARLEDKDLTIDKLRGYIEYLEKNLPEVPKTLPQC